MCTCIDGRLNNCCKMQDGVCKLESQFKVGDRVYSLIRGKGTVISVDQTCIRVSAEQTNNASVGISWYNLDGTWFGPDYSEVVLFHDKPTIIPAKPKIKKWNWAYTTKYGQHFVTYTKYSTLVDLDDYCNIDRAKMMKLPWTEIEE